jgi:hypothetical protein
LLIALGESFVIIALVIVILIAVKLDFLKPFELHNTAEFTMDPRAGGTHVMWAMYGPNAFTGKVMSVFVDMERIIGKGFETGLANLKSAAER